MTNQLQIPEGFMLVRYNDLIALLAVAIVRGEKLGVTDGDNDYREWITEIRADKKKDKKSDGDKLTIVHVWDMDECEEVAPGEYKLKEDER